MKLRKWAQHTLEAVTALGLTSAIVLFSRAEAQGETDLWTPRFLVLILFVAMCLRGSSALWSRGLAQREEGALNDLREQASASALIVNGSPRLPTARADALVQTLREQPGELHPPGWLSQGQSILVSLGLAGTFFGLTMGLYKAVPSLVSRPGITPEDATKAMQLGMEVLLGGAKLAFAKSLAGVVCAMVWGLHMQLLDENKDAVFSRLFRTLDRDFPAISQEEMILLSIQRLTKMESAGEREGKESRDRHKALIEVLTTQHGGLLDRCNARTKDVTGILKELSISVNTKGDDLVRSVGDLSAKVDGLASSLPEDIGTSTGQKVTTSLQPAFDQLSTNLRALSEAGGQAIGKVFQGDVEQEVKDIKQALNGLSTSLIHLPTSVTTAMDDANSRLSVGAGQAAKELSAAATNVSAQVIALQAAAVGVTNTLQRSSDLATELTTAGTSVRDALKGVAGPIEAVPAAFKLAQGALAETATTLNTFTTNANNAATTALAAQKTSEEASRTFATDTASLAVQVKEAAKACETLTNTLNTITGGQTTAHADALTKLTATLDAFKTAMEDAGRALTTSTNDTFGKVEGVSQRAATEVADALEKGAGRLKEAMEQAAGHSETMTRGLATAKETTGEIEGVAGRVRDALTGAAAPLERAATSLQAVPGSVDRSVAALKAQEITILAIAGSLGKQVAAANELTTQLTNRVEGEHRATEAQLRLMTGHIDRVTDVNAKVQTAWALAYKATTEGISSNSQQIATYAKKVEDSLGIPNDLRRLDETVSELNDVLIALTQILKPPGSTVGGPPAPARPSTGGNRT